MKYEDWLKLQVTCSDLRAFGIDGFQDYQEPVPGVAFMKPVHGEFRGHPIIDRYDCLGWITYDSKRMMWDVLIENTEKEFIALEPACRYLWDNWYKDELDPGPRYRLIGVDERGHLVTNQLCADFREVISVIERDLPDPEYSKRAIADLSRVGNRFHEFAHGHYAAFPLDE
jgi:hypothetical protein